jgi:hypothetical protein
MRPQLEAVFFFNPEQAQWHREIHMVIEKHGVPEIREIDDYLTLGVRGEDRVQTLFALSPQVPPSLEGVVVFGRFHYAEILILHLAVARPGPIADFTMRQRIGGVDFLGLVTAFNKVMKRIAGVERVRFAYWDLAIPLV